MAITYSAKGTSFPSFQVGRQGITILQGTIDPVVGQGTNGDMYVQAGATPALWQKIAGTWNKIGNFGSKIFSGTTSVDTTEVANTITFNVNGKRVANVVGDPSSLLGEKITFKTGVSNVTVLVEDTSTTNAVDMIIDLQGQGALKVQSDADAALRTSDGSPITIQPGAKSVGAGGSTFIVGGSTTAVGAAGGNVVLQPGVSGSGAALAQVVVPAGYVAASESSVVSRLDQATWLTVVVTTETSHAVGLNEQIVIVKRAGADTGVVLPASAATGRQVKVKSGLSNSAVTVTVNGGGTIDGAANKQFTNYNFATFVFDGTVWLSI